MERYGMDKQQKNIPFSRPDIGELERQAVDKVLKSSWLAAGMETEAFEGEFADYINIKYAIFTNSGTSALKMAYKWAKEQGADSLVIPKNTFCATYSAAAEIGLKYSHVENSDPRFKVNVHYGGVKDQSPCLIEDSAHRIEPNDPLVGKIRCYSFYATKNMTTGFGGMLVTNNKKIYERCRLYWRDGLSSSTRERREGKSWNYRVATFAGGYDGNDIAAAIGRVQLKRLPLFNKHRNEIVSKYNKAFNQQWSGNHLYPFFLKSQTDVVKLIKYFKSRGISCGYHYPGNNWRGVSLPLFPLLRSSDITYIISSVKEFISKNK
jgi:dTDP-4-amino-4,6-dideoxygalactose transaminase